MLWTAIRKLFWKILVQTAKMCTYYWPVNVSLVSDRWLHMSCIVCSTLWSMLLPPHSYFTTQVSTIIFSPLLIIFPHATTMPLKLDLHVHCHGNHFTNSSISKTFQIWSHLSEVSYLYPGPFKTLRLPLLNSMLYLILILISLPLSLHFPVCPITTIIFSLVFQVHSTK